jgi:predicted GNAT family N-acyltransferase
VGNLSRGIDIRIDRGLAIDSPAREIRHEVFELEQQLPEEFDEIDERALHAVLYLDGAAVACARAFPEKDENGLWHLGRFAVRKPFRRQGLGSHVLKALEETANSRGAQGFTLDAQLHAVPFYEAHGYAPVTGAYEICRCLHVTMRKEPQGAVAL